VRSEFLRILETAPAPAQGECMTRRCRRERERAQHDEPPPPPPDDIEETN
jgi:hypothetical protein